MKKEKVGLKSNRIYKYLAGAKKLISGTLLIWLVSMSRIYANTGVDELDNGINNLMSLAKGLIRAIGGLFLLFGAYRMATTINSRDANERREGIWSIVAGLLLLFAPEIVNFLVGKKVL